MKYEKRSLSKINGILSDTVAEEGGWGKRISKDQEFEAKLGNMTKYCLKNFF